MELIELNHAIEDGTITYPGLDAPRVCDFWTREATAERYGGDTSFHIARVDMVANTGTYIDAPFHRYADGEDVSEIALDRVTELPGLCLDLRGAGAASDAARFEGIEVSGRAVLVLTGHDRHFGTEAYARDHPHLTEAAAVYLRDAGAALVGIDSLNIDATDIDTRPVHSTLLAAGIPIVEHMTGLDRLPPEGFVFCAAPVRFRGLGSFPVRAYARVVDSR